MQFRLGSRYGRSSLRPECQRSQFESAGLIRCALNYHRPSRNVSAPVHPCSSGMRSKDMRFSFLPLAAALVLAAPSHAQTLTIGVRAGPESMDPDYTGVGTHAEALKHIFDTLVWAGDQLQLEPGLAESWRPIDSTTHLGVQAAA